MQALQSYHIKVPDDISVAGFDGSYISSATNPKLTTVSQNYEQVGKETVDTILDILSNRTTSKTKLIETKLIIRDSCRKI
jgi:DNA-binding LacI/PurR family transcriptional regulator